MEEHSPCYYEIDRNKPSAEFSGVFGDNVCEDSYYPRPLLTDEQLKDLREKIKQSKENPKQSNGSNKVGMHVIPPSILMQIALAMTEGEIRYSGYNWRDSPVKASTYYDSTWRHISDWYEGQDIDVKSGLPHIIKAIAGLIVLADGIQQGKFIDDRPPKHVDSEWLDKLNAKHVEVVKKAKAQCTG